MIVTNSDSRCRVNRVQNLNISFQKEWFPKTRKSFISSKD